MSDAKEDLQHLFSYYYEHNSWGSQESKSGPGSTVYESKELIHELPKLLQSLAVKTILDAPCGDFNWMKEVNLDSYEYIGVDIVADCIRDNQRRYQKSSIQFLEKDIVHDTLPKADLIICRDGLVHFPNPMVKEAIENFKRSGSTYLLTTHFPNTVVNNDIAIGDWRPINFTLPPFNFEDPIFMIKETLPIKTMALWKLDDL
ncbi:class I SAM-dependent methyltransferase [Alicyclobacillus tolerans]|uniref:class I SAM-dependent methyltransferase n=1 Tax=Alicyclobacillus tolerans TaxID=90970 RepID=UPI001F1FAEDC|nr:class I SAM-dependent methyltransferase [Alicyclobacillus tolerans]MCF8568501.1 class I SAM-dependent methyltransferase [Alicyclobacillus tolerans]